jgi:GGDEF domain-containing protein
LISLKKILHDDGATEATLLRVVRLLLQGIQEHAIVGDADDLGGLRMNIQRLSAALETGMAAAELLVQSGSVLQTFEDYNRRTDRYLKRPAGEWQAVVTMLISAVAAMATADERTVGRLREISGEVGSANGLGEVQKVRLQLAECLKALQLDIQKPPGIRSVARPAPTDTPVAALESGETNGFATRTQAEEALAAAWQSDPPSYAAVMALDRLQIFKMRFGPAVADETFRFFSDFLRRRFRPGDGIYRWNANAVLVLMARPNRLEIVRDEVARLMEVRCEHTVQTASRSILLPIAARWTVFPSMAAPKLLIHNIDAFAEAKGRNE